MSTCASCAARAEETAAFCPRCGAPMLRGPRRRARLALFSLAGLVAAAAIAWPGISGLRASSSCEPKGWVDWHVAMQRACLTPEYVCRNMTTSKLLEDPAVENDVRRALESGDGSAMQALESLVNAMRAEYGCVGTSRGPGRPWPRGLPPGHPPIGPDAAPTFDAPGAIDI